MAYWYGSDLFCIFVCVSVDVEKHHTKMYLVTY